MSLRRRNSGVEMAGIARYVGRTGFSMSMTFFFLALGALFFMDVGAAEQIILVVIVWVNAAIGFGSAMLLRMMHKSDVQYSKRLKQERNAQGNKTLEQWMESKTSNS